MRDLKSKIDYSVLKTTDSDCAKVVLLIIKAYQYAIGMEKELFQIDYVDIFTDIDMSVTATQMQRMILSHSNDHYEPWSTEKINALLPDMVSLIHNMAKEGESLFPEVELIETISGDDEQLLASLTEDWESLHEDNTREAYYFVNSFIDINIRKYALPEWKRLRKNFEAVQALDEYTKRLNSIRIMDKVLYR